MLYLLLRRIFLLCCIIFYFTSGFALAEEAIEYKFTLQKSDDNKLFFSLKLQGDDIIYSNQNNIRTSTFPTNIKIYPSGNLKSYKLRWPDSKYKYQESYGKIEYFDGEVIIYLDIEAYDYEKPVKLSADIEFAVCNTQCIIVHNTIKEDLILQENNYPITEYLWFLSIAVLGGFILNFMPCVLPVLSLKILFFVKNKSIDKRVASFLTILGIFSCFWIIATLIILLKNSGKQFGLGVNFQVPEFIILLTILITCFVSIALGRVNTGLSSIGNTLNKMRFINPYMEHYFSGIIATILSTACNAPFIGPALIFSLTIGDSMVVLMFSAIAFGFSLPYFSLILFPSALKFIPRPGVWIEIFQKFLAILLMGTIAWLLWILMAQIGDRAAFGLFLLLLLFKFTLENSTKFLKNRLIKIILLLMIVIASMFMPQYAYEEDTKQEENINQIWRKFEPAKIQSLIRDGKIVFVDITADWCVTCKYNKFMTLNRAGTLKLLKEKNVIAMRGDFTYKDSMIYEFLNYHKTIGIPFYIIYGPGKPEGLVLPLIISYRDIASAIEIVR